MKKTLASSVIALLLAIVVASIAFAGPTANVRVPFKGTLQATETDLVPAPYDTLYVDGQGAGNATHLGQYTIHFTAVVDTATLSGPDIATFVAANGDSLSTTGT